MFLVWFGLGETSKVAFIAYTTFFPMFVGIASSVSRVDVMLLRAAASLGATRAALMRHVVLARLAARHRRRAAPRLRARAVRHRRRRVHGRRRGTRPLIMEGRVFFNPAQIVMGALAAGRAGIGGQCPAAGRRSDACSAVARRRDRHVVLPNERSGVMRNLTLFFLTVLAFAGLADPRSPRASPRSPRSMRGSCGTRRCPRSSPWRTRWATSRRRASR